MFVLWHVNQVYLQLTRTQNTVPSTFYDTCSAKERSTLALRASAAASEASQRAAAYSAAACAAASKAAEAAERAAASAAAVQVCLCVKNRTENENGGVKLTLLGVLHQKWPLIISLVLTCKRRLP